MLAQNSCSRARAPGCLRWRKWVSGGLLGSGKISSSNPGPRRRSLATRLYPLILESSEKLKPSCFIQKEGLQSLITAESGRNLNSNIPQLSRPGIAGLHGVAVLPGICPSATPALTRSGKHGSLVRIDYSQSQRSVSTSTAG